MKDLEENIISDIKNNFKYLKSKSTSNQMRKRMYENIIFQSKRKVEIQLLKQIEDRFDTVNGMLEKNNNNYYDKINR